MEESSSETSYDELLEMLKWDQAILLALLQHHGGSVKIEKELLEDMDLSQTIRVYQDVEGNYIIESGGTEDAVQ